MDMSSVLTQMGILVFIMAVGFVCAKLGVTGRAFNRSVSGVVMNVLLVFTILYSVMSTDMEMTLGDIGLAVLFFSIMLLLCGLMGWLCARLMRLGKDTAGIACFSLFFSNTVFVAFPVIESIYGTQGVFLASLSNIPFNLLAYTAGTMAISGEGRASISLKKALSAPLVATLVAVAVFLSGLKVPAPIVDAFGTIGKATVPMSMLIVGTSLGGISIRRALSDWRVYILSFLRLLVVPFVVWLLLKGLVQSKMLLDELVILASAPTAMIATILAIRYEKNEAFASECVFISTLFSAVTMPLVIWLLL